MRLFHPPADRPHDRADARAPAGARTRRRPLRRGATAATLALALLGPAPLAAAETTTPTPDSAEDLVDLDILSINDFHGRLEQNGDVAGASRLACTVDARRAENPNTLFVSAGDNVGASTFTSFIQDDQPTLDALNAMELDVSALGNHEFDGGSDDVDDRLIPESDFPLLGANIVDEAGEPLYRPYAIEEVDGVDVGFIGVITEDMPQLVSPAGVEGIRWADMSETVDRYAEQLTSQDEADVVVVLAHAGLEGTELSAGTGTPFGQLVEDAPDTVDAIISAHTHQEYALQTADGTWVTQTGQYGEGLGSLEMTYDRASGEVVDSQAETIDLVDAEDPEAGACTDEEVQGIVDDAVAYAEEAGAEVVGEVSGDLPLDRAQNTDGSENRAASSPLGSFVADAQVWAARRTTPEVDFGVMNPGGLRSDIGSGEVTYEELATSQPFANTLAVVELTGEQVRRLLEQQWREEGSIKLAQSAELRYTYDPAAPVGERLGEVWVDGEPLEDGAAYQVVANSFLASGGDGFSVLAEAPSTDTGMTDLTGIVDYVEEHTPITPADELRSTAVTWLTDPDASYAPGETIELEVGGLAHSTDAAPAGETLEVSLGEAAPQAVALDTSFVDGADLRGRASISIDVPADVAAGTVPLTLHEPVTGTTVTLPVTVAEDDDQDDGDEASPGGPPEHAPGQDPEHAPGEIPEHAPGHDPEHSPGQIPDHARGAGR